VALGRAAGLVSHSDLKHDERAPLGEWLLRLRELHARARQDSAGLEDQDHVLAERSRSGRLPQRWLGSSPSFRSRGR